MSKKSAARTEADRLVVAHPEAPTRTLAQRIAREYKIPVESARSLVRSSRGANGIAMRKKSKPSVARPAQPSGWRPTMPRSVAEPWVDFELQARRLGVMNDLHIPFHDDQALRAAIKLFKSHRLDTLLVNGDAMDFYWASRFDKNPKTRDFLFELKSGREFFAWLRREFPRQRLVLKMGNHEERWDKMIWNHHAMLSSDPLLSLRQWLYLDDHGVELVGGQRPVVAGHLPILHGHELPKGITSPVNVASSVFRKLGGSAMIGHHHRLSVHNEPTWRHEPKTTWSIGCLCSLNPEYAVINRWDHSVARVDIAQDGTYEVMPWKKDQGSNRFKRA